MFVTYSLGGNARSIWATRLEGLPTFEEPFFMVREGWGPEVEIMCNTASFRDNSSSLPLVLTRKLTQKASLKLSFEAKAQMMTAFAQDAVLLTVGGKTRNGMHLAANKNLLWQVTIGEETFNLGKVKMGERQRFEMVMDTKGFSIGIDGADPKRFDTQLLRKICFGGLYQHPLGYPSNTWVDLDLASVELR
jgi:hypothetical protein